MSAIERQYPFLAACGLNCGLCPRHYTEGSSKCPGCGGPDFYAKHPKCGVLSCCERREIEYCFQCEEYPCKKYDKAEKDSFISHQNIFANFEKVKSIGLEAYQRELNEKAVVLACLLENYNDGRRKSFYCNAVSLLALSDSQRILNQLKAEAHNLASPKEKAAAAVKLFQDAGDEKGISLKLNK